MSVIIIQFAQSCAKLIADRLATDVVFANCATAYQRGAFFCSIPMRQTYSIRMFTKGSTDRMRIIINHGKMN